MTNKLRIGFLAGAIALCSVPQLACAETFLAPYKTEAVSITLKPGWHMANKMVQKGVFLLQFLPEGEDPKVARTMVNIATYSHAPGDAKTFAKRQQASAPQAVKTGKLEFKILDDSNPNDVMYQITISGNPTFPDQFEIHRVIKGKQGIHDVTVHVKPATPPPEQVAEMREVLATVKLVDPPKGNSNK